MAAASFWKPPICPPLTSSRHRATSSSGSGNRKTVTPVPIAEHHHKLQVQMSVTNQQQNGNEPAAAAASSLTVVSFYKFADLPDYAQKRQALVEICNKHHVSGGIILAAEGINGSICGTREAVDEVLAAIQADARLAKLRMTEAPASEEDEVIHDEQQHMHAGEHAPFRWDHVRVKLKKEVVPLGIPGVDPAKKVGRYVKPAEWNELISDPDTVVVDVRNSYETRLGKFKGAVDPKTVSFREFPKWVERHLTNAEDGDADGKKPRRIATYCTGGIRCEKATAFLLNQGFDEVYHLEGGILKYLEEFEPENSLWEGECFVFDKRVSVNHGLKPGSYYLCYACKKPVSEDDMRAAEWEYGVSCPYCFSEKTEVEKERARARQRQFEKWGILGGPDKGRKTKSASSQHQEMNNI